MSAVVAFVAGVVAVAVLERTTRAVFSQPVLRRTNYRGHSLSTASGLLLVAGVIAVEGGRVLVDLITGSDADLGARWVVLTAVVAFGFLGLVDDLLGDAHDRGLKGHVAAALHGRFTTGFLKLGGGAAVALLLARLMVGDDAVEVLVAGALIALAANMGNLFDRAPGRTLKVGLLAYLPLVVATGGTSVAVAVAVVAGGAVGLLPGDLRERSMIGDTGANAWGAALGVAAVAGTSPLDVAPAARLAVTGGLLALTLLSEVVSFSRVIERVAPLRFFDRMGRLPTDG